MIKVEAGGGRSLSGEMGLVERLFVDYKSRVCVVKSVLCDISCTSAFGIAERLYNAISTESGLSFRAERRDSYPCSKKPIQTAFPSKNPEQIPWIDHGSKPFIVGTDNPKPQKKRQYRKPNPRSDLNDVI